MKPKNYNKIKIDITLKSDKTKFKDNNLEKKMCDLCDNRHRRICSLCLKETQIDDNNKPKQSPKYCGVCNSPLCLIKSDSDEQIDPCTSRNVERETHEAKDKNKSNTLNKQFMSKTVNEITNDKEIQKVETQTSKTEAVDLAKGLNLLTEVLNVFHNKKIADKPSDTPQKEFKHASVNTVEIQSNSKHKLSRSKLVKYSIEEEKRLSMPTGFVILEARHPEMNKSQFCLNLTRGKSSSIPRMKLEELKHSLREKTKSKDAIEEVNRMFATVRKFDDVSEDSIGSNRPMVRNGPRVLPLVKTGSRMLMAPKEMRDNFCAVSPRASTRCQHCQTTLSGGDSKDTKVCRCQDIRRCEKCTYMLSHSHGQKGIMMCEGVRKSGCRCRDGHETDVTIWNTNDS